MRGPPCAYLFVGAKVCSDKLFECVHHRVYMSMDLYLRAHVRAGTRDRSGSLLLIKVQGHELKHFFRIPRG